MLEIMQAITVCNFKENKWAKLWKMAKNLVLTQFWPIWTKFWRPKFVFKNLASSVTRYHGQLSSYTISEKTNDPILRELSDGQTDRQTDRQEWFHIILSDLCRASKRFTEWNWYCRRSVSVHKNTFLLLIDFHSLHF